MSLARLNRHRAQSAIEGRKKLQAAARSCEHEEEGEEALSKWKKAKRSIQKFAPLFRLSSSSSPPRANAAVISEHVPALNDVE